MHVMGAIWGREMGYNAYTFLVPAPDVNEWSASRSGRASPLYPLDRRLGWPQSLVDAEATREVLCPCQGPNPGRSVLDTILSELPWLIVSTSW
jgi:hypothetical protein